MLPEENAVVWYSLLPGPGYELFSINPYTGLITTASTLDREQQQRFTLRGRKTQKTAESGRNPPRGGPGGVHRTCAGCIFDTVFVPSLAVKAGNYSVFAFLLSDD